MDSDHKYADILDESELENPKFDTNEIHSTGISEERFDANCNQLFKQQVAKFNGRSKNTMDLKIEELIETIGSTIPILHIKDKLYLIGSQRLTLEMINNIVFVNTPSGKKQQFIQYIPNHHKFHERKLLLLMIKSG